MLSFKAGDRRVDLHHIHRGQFSIVPERHASGSQRILYALRDRLWSVPTRAAMADPPREEPHA